MKYWSRLAMLTIVCIAVLRSMVEPGAARPPGNYWQQLKIARAQTENAIAQLPGGSEERAKARNRLAELSIQDKDIEAAIPIMTERWEKAASMNSAGFNSEFMTAADSMAELYLVRGNLDHAATCFQQLLDYDLPRLGKNHPFIARDLNNLALVYYFKGTTCEDEKSRAEYLNKAIELLERSRETLSAKGVQCNNLAQSSTSTTTSVDNAVEKNASFDIRGSLAVIEKNLAMAEREKRFYSASSQ